MKALVYHGPGEKSWTDVPDPQIQNPTDVIVRIDTTTICGTDLHILKGDVPAVTPGRILGHEGVGIITQVGSSVTQLAVGDNVIISCIKSCGHCSFCQQGIFAHCLGDEGASGIGWVFGHLIDGTQGRVRAGPVRRDIRVQSARRGHKPAGRAAQRHPADGL
jgi:alcohol dehydrogenase